jgi:phage terminase small subunit
MTKQKENFIKSSLTLTPEEKAKEKKHRESQIRAEKKKAGKKVVKKAVVSNDNIEESKGIEKVYIEKEKACTAKQEAFARQYLVARCKAAAYRYAYDCENLGEQGIYSKAIIVYNTPIVLARIMELQEESNKRIEITTDKIQQEIAKLAFTHLPGIINYNKGIISLNDFDNLSDNQRACIKKFEFVTEYKVGEDGKAQPCDRVKIEVYDRQKSLDSLAKINGMFIDRSEIKTLGHNMNFSGDDKGVL